MITAIQGIGYQVRLAHTTIPIRGMHCASCVGTIEHALRNVPGVVQAEVHFGTEQATVTYVPTRVEVSALYQAIGEAGYEALANATETDITPIEASKKEEMRDLQRRFIVSLCLSLPVVVGSMGGMLAWVPAWLHHPVLLFLLSTPVQFWVGWPFYQGCWAALKHKTADMNTLIALGTSAAYVYSVIMTFVPGVFVHTHGAAMPHVYYETAVVIITLILLGRWLEARARGQTSAAISHVDGVASKNGASDPEFPRPGRAHCRGEGGGSRRRPSRRESAGRRQNR